jgi:hypothetical protein
MPKENNSIEMGDVVLMISLAIGASILWNKLNLPTEYTLASALAAVVFYIIVKGKLGS